MAVDLLESVVVGVLLLGMTLFDFSTEATPPAAVAVACGWFALLCVEVPCGRPLVWQLAAAAGSGRSARFVAERRARLRYWCRAKLALFSPWFVILCCGYLTERP